MKKMKSILLALVLTAGSVAFLNSCKDECKDVTCANGGTCDAGTCTCAAGYEGTDCSTEARTKFIGTFGTTEDCSNSAAQTYDITITTSSTGVDKILIGNFWNAFTNKVTATVDGSSLTIADQQPDNDNFWISGSGSISGNSLSLTYTITDKNVTPNTTDNCTNTTFTKK